LTFSRWWNFKSWTCGFWAGVFETSVSCT